MTRWLCTACRRAGTSADAVCCERAFPVAARGDEVEWLRTRIESKPRDVQHAIMCVRFAPSHALIYAIARHVQERGGLWL